MDATAARPTCRSSSAAESEAALDAGERRGEDAHAGLVGLGLAPLEAVGQLRVVHAQPRLVQRRSARSADGRCTRTVTRLLSIQWKSTTARWSKRCARRRVAVLRIGHRNRPMLDDRAEVPNVPRRRLIVDKVGKVEELALAVLLGEGTLYEQP